MVAFAVVGLVLAVMITASVVAAAVIASYRRSACSNLSGPPPPRSPPTCWAIAPAIIAAAIALPGGMALQQRHARHRQRLSRPAANPRHAPGGLVHVYTPGGLALLALAGLAIAVTGALGPATWAAASPAHHRPPHPNNYSSATLMTKPTTGLPTISAARRKFSFTFSITQRDAVGRCNLPADT